MCHTAQQNPRLKVGRHLPQVRTDASDFNILRKYVLLDLDFEYVYKEHNVIEIREYLEYTCVFEVIT